MKKINNTDITKAIIVFNALLMLLGVWSYKMWKGNNRVITWDVTSYYSYLPAAVIYKDIELKFINPDPEKYWDKFVPHKSPSGGNVIKMSMGLAIVYSPFFFIAHFVAKPLGFPADGFSEPYRLALILSSVFFNILGLVLLSKLLLIFYSKLVVFLTLAAIALGTNLLYYTVVRSAMSHSYNFALITLFLLLVIKWHQKQSLLISIFTGLLAGLIVLIRPTNIVFSLFFIFFNILTLNQLKERFQLFFNKFHLISILIFCAFLIWIPQLLYWKLTTGNYLHFSYQGESFYFNNPQIIKGLFSYRNGWLLYTPIMTFAILGFYFLFKNFKALFLPVLIPFVLFVYVVLSWWCWWYVGFGNRAFIDSYGLLALPLAALLEWIIRQKKIIKYIFFSVFSFFILLNIFQGWQYKMGFIQFDSMSKKAYWTVFGSFNPHDRFWPHLKHPDYEKALQGIYEDKIKEEQK